MVQTELMLHILHRFIIIYDMKCRKDGVGKNIIFVADCFFIGGGGGARLRKYVN